MIIPKVALPIHQPSPTVLVSAMAITWVLAGTIALPFEVQAKLRHSET